MAVVSHRPQPIRLSANLHLLWTRRDRLPLRPRGPPAHALRDLAADGAVGLVPGAPGARALPGPRAVRRLGAPADNRARRRAAGRDHPAGRPVVPGLRQPTAARASGST